jgi:hypothetical protein
MSLPARSGCLERASPSGDQTLPGGPGSHFTVTEPSRLVMTDMPLLLPTPEPGEGTPSTPPPPSEHLKESSDWTSLALNVRVVPSVTTHALAGLFEGVSSEAEVALPQAVATKARLRIAALTLGCITRLRRSASRHTFPVCPGAHWCATRGEKDAGQMRCRNHAASASERAGPSRPARSRSAAVVPPERLPTACEHHLSGHRPDGAYRRLALQTFPVPGARDTRSIRPARMRAVSDVGATASPGSRRADRPPR